MFAIIWGICFSLEAANGFTDPGHCPDAGITLRQREQCLERGKETAGHRAGARSVLRFEGLCATDSTTRLKELRGSCRCLVRTTDGAPQTKDFRRHWGACSLF